VHEHDLENCPNCGGPVEPLDDAPRVIQIHGEYWPQGVGRPGDRPEVPSTIHWDLWLGVAPERPYHPAYHPFRWRGWWDFGTGALGDMACHIMDAGYWGLQLGYPVEVEAEGDPLKPECGPKWMIVKQKFPARKDLPAVDVTWYDGGKLPPEEKAAGIKLRGKDKDGNEKNLVGNGNIFVGDKGTIVVTDEQSGAWKIVAKDGTVASATTKSSTMNDSAVESCVAGRFLRMQFPEPRGGGIVIVSYPLSFSTE